MSSAICFNLDQSKILSPGNGLKLKENGVLNFNQRYCRPTGKLKNLLIFYTTTITCTKVPQTNNDKGSS